MTNSSSATLSLLSILSCAGIATAQNAYDVIDLGTLAMQSNAAAINNANQVVGTSVAADAYFNAASFSINGPIALSPFVGFRNTVATAITDNGVTYGVGFNLGSLTPVALRYDLSGPVALGTFSPRAARLDGVIVGCAPSTSAGLTYDVACVYSAGLLTLLPSLGGAQSQAFDIDNFGRIVGSSTLAGGGEPLPTLWVNGIATNLGTLGGTRGQAKSLNDAGIAVGFSENAAGLARPTKWTVDAGGAVLSRVDLASPFPGRPAFVNDINTTGTAVGTAAFHAIRWFADGTSVDLNSFLPPLSGWTLEVASALNNNGAIVGTGSLRGFPRAFMLIPISCAGDFNRDGTLDFFDYLDFVSAFSTGEAIADFNHDGIVDFFDYLDFVNAFSAGC